MSSKFYLLIGLGLIFLAGCEEEYIPETVFEQPEIVVEGYIEKADSALPPYVLLTESRPYLSEFSTETINGMFVHGADVRISDGTDTVQLTEICLADLAGLDTALRNSVAQGLGLSSNGILPIV